MTLVLIQTSANLSPFSATYRTESLFCNRLVPWHCDKKEGNSKHPGVRKASPSRGPLGGEPVSAEGSVFHHVVWKCLQGKVSPRGFSALQGLRGLQPQAVPAIPLGYQKTSTWCHFIIDLLLGVYSLTLAWYILNKLTWRWKHSYL